MSVSHVMASGMGGIRTAGDPAGMMQMAQRMRLSEVKRYVAGKLGVAVDNVFNEQVMGEVREEPDLGIITSVPGNARGMEANFRIAH